MNNVSRLSLVFFVTILSVRAYAYDVSTHQDMSTAALAASNLESRLGDLGIKGIDERLATDAVVEFNILEIVGCQELAFGVTERLSIRQLIRRGAFCEDVSWGTGYPLRYLFHFYDPAHDGQGVGGWSSSLTWGLEATPIAAQEFSYADAKAYLYQAVTSPGQVNREKNFAKAFRTLGHLMHLVQDLAQPQHTRGDSHASGSLYERYTNLDVPGSRIRSNLPFLGYPAVSASLPGQFWHTPDLKGLADYSNRGFVTAGTNFTGSAGSILPNPGFPLPDSTGSSIDKRQITDSDLLGPVGPGQPLVGEIWFVSTPVYDGYLGTSVTNTRTSTFSIFDSDLKIHNSSWTFTLNRFNFAEAHKLLVPRAVGYSAGLLNYLFRGGMDMALPSDGVYAVVDTTSNGCGSPCGFRKVKLLIKNATPNDEMGAGTLQVVARFRRNTCFRADLSGDYGGPAFVGNSCRSADEYVSVSSPLAVGSVARSYPSQAFVFALPTPIPIDASDVSLQVVFRGVLGQETDAVAVTTKDIAEPNHFAVSNMSDYVFDDVGDQQYHSLPYLSITTDMPVSGFGIAFGTNQTPLATVPLLRGGQFARLAYLTDKFTADVPMTMWYWGSPHDHFVQPDAFELDESTGEYRRSCPVFPERGLYWDKLLFFAQFRSTSSHGPLAQAPAAGRGTGLIGGIRAAGGDSTIRYMKAAYACGVPSGGEFEMDSLTPFAAPNALPWTVNF